MLLCLPASHLVVKHALILATLEDVLWKLDFHFLSPSPLLDLLLHIVVVPASKSESEVEKVFIHLNGKGWGLSILSS